MMRQGHFNTPGNSACWTGTCGFLARVGRAYCCNRCPEHKGQRHSRNCARAFVSAEITLEGGLLVAQNSMRNVPNMETSSYVPLLAGLSDRQHSPYNALNMNNQSFNFSFLGTGYRLSDRVDDFTQSDDIRFSLPAGWARGNDTVMEYLQWFTVRYQTEFDSKTLAEWNQTEMIFNAIDSRRDSVQRETGRGPLQIHAYPHDALPHRLQYIDVDTGIPCTAMGAGNLKYLTGCDFAVMARLTSQQSTAIALRLAMLQIELQGLLEIAFTCLGGTHRSVGCACLLAVVFYPEAHLVFHTDRTRSAASERLQAVSW